MVALKKLLPEVQPRICPHFRDISSQRILTLTLIPQGHSGSNLMVPNLAQACSRRLSAILQNFSLIAQMVYEMCVTKCFHFLTLGLTPGPKFTKGEMTCYPPRSTILPNFIALLQSCRRYPFKNLADKQRQTDRQTETVNDISPAFQHAYRHVGIISTPVIPTGVYSHMPIP